MKTSKKRRTVKRQNHQPRTDRRLRTESLEGRLLMAADMAAWSVNQQSDEQAEEKTDSAITSSETSSSETTKKPTASKQHGKKTAVSLPKELKLKLAEQSAAQSEEITASEETRELDKAPVSGKDQERIDLEQKVDLPDLEDHEPLFGDFADLFAANDALFREVLDLGPANVFGDNIARDNLAGRFETGPDLSLEGIGVGESMAADDPVRDAAKDYGFYCLSDSAAYEDGSEQMYRSKESLWRTCNKLEDNLGKELKDAKKRGEPYVDARHKLGELEGIEAGKTDKKDAKAKAEEAKAREAAEKEKKAAEKKAAEKKAEEEKDDGKSLVQRFIDWWNSTPAPEDMQGDHPLPADLLTGLATATAQAYQDLYNLHEGGDGRNPEYNPLAGFAGQAYSRQDLEDAVSIGGGGGCGQDDEGTPIDPNSLRRTFTLSNTIEGGCRGPEDLY